MRVFTVFVREPRIFVEFPYNTRYHGFRRHFEFFREQTRGLQTNVWEIKNTTERFLAQLQPSEFASKVLCLVP